MTLLLCHTASYRGHSRIACQQRQVTGGIFVSGATPVHARLLRNGRQLFTGWSITHGHGRSSLILAGGHRLGHGTYTLKLRLRRHRHWITMTEPIMVT